MARIAKSNRAVTSGRVVATNRAQLPVLQNILTYSNDLTQATWTKTSSTATYNQTGPSNNTCSELKEVAATSSHKVSVSPGHTNGKTYTLSGYFKKGATARDYVLLTVNNGNNGAWFNINTGAVATSANILNKGISSLGNGWYRCWITYTKTAAMSDQTDVWIANVDGGSSYAGDTNYSLLVDNLQINEGPFPGPATPTSGSAVNSGAPRSDLLCN